jgi:hypothetical protein
MLFLNRKPGERLILETPAGRIVINLLGNQQVGVELPPGVEVLNEGPDEGQPARGRRPNSWLPARPSKVTG